MKIEKEQYTIRNWETKDYTSLAKNANNIHIWNNVRDYFPYPYTESDAKEFIGFAIGKSNELAIEIDGNAVGGIGFTKGTDVERYNAEIGYWLGENYWNKGIMTSIVKDISKYIFENTDIIRLYAPVFAFNTASQKVLEKAGFQKIAVLNNAAIKNGKIINMHYFEMLK